MAPRATGDRALDEQRRTIEKQLQESPGLRSQLDALVAEAYPDAVRDAVHETGFLARTFPVSSPFPVQDILDPDYLPPDAPT